MTSQLYACPPGALPGGLTRTRFFDGMFLTQADLETEQVYWRMKRRLTNRALGTGIVWGLKVRVDLATQKITLSPGYALDCCGNDLVVECPIEASVGEIWARSLEYMAVPQISNGRDVIPACLALQYVECPDGPRAIHRDACGPAVGGSCETSRVRETVRLIFVPRCTPPVVEPPPGGGGDQNPEDACAAEQYPGPRCLDLHHGVYLGCGSARRNGAIVSFSMCEPASRRPCRRPVMTGPWLEFTAAHNNAPSIGRRVMARGGASLVERAVADEPSLQPLARAPVSDFLVEVIHRMPLADVDPAFATLTIGGLLAAEPEALLSRMAGDVAPTDAQRAVVNKLVADTEAKVRGFATKAVRTSAKLVGSRDRLAVAEIQEALAKGIELSGLTPEIVTSAAIAASRR
ncbi:MAG: hypothetical protein ABI867_07945 [Kofleriaceae bacterium]